LATLFCTCLPSFLLAVSLTNRSTFIRKLQTENDPCHGEANCLNHGDLPLLKNIRQGLIDPDTPSSAKTKTAADGTTQLQLVFSDEFNTDGRTFYPGDDPYFEAANIWYGVTQDLEWYDPDAITTKDGVLEIRLDAIQNHGLNYRSGMLQSWNQLCFQGGHLEASISLPGAGDVMGFWPGFWSMGNLGRPGYAASTDGLWPYSYDDVCDAGITPNQSQTDGISFLPGMRLPACTCSGQSHPNPGKSRSAPEIDVIEASAGPLDGKNIIGQVSQSFQVAPFDIWWYPDYGKPKDT
jgi:beta-glucan synthesis-associated protein KRE6